MKDAELITCWNCPNCGLPADSPFECPTCRYGYPDFDQLTEGGLISFADGGEAEREHLAQRKEAMERTDFDRVIDRFCLTGRWEDK